MIILNDLTVMEVIAPAQKIKTYFDYFTLCLQQNSPSVLVTYGRTCRLSETLNKVDCVGRFILV